MSEAREFFVVHYKPYCDSYDQALKVFNNKQLADEFMIGQSKMYHVREVLDETDHAAALADALDWYADKAKEMGKAAIRGDSKRMLSLMNEIAVDYGKRAGTQLSVYRASLKGGA